ncbi:hypothetical protein P691DRAFT_662941 [Macrolepiota fuliginosa MF-IS2]|uniref:Uncharacterized protein n=1 Tax=Macrolepiota fuliginosa MF-IS2 TaxID=1400762 RepID=A0A9P5XII3_9AGAR|nr:hypothetical protein P691DRAFT_662941 [Macrolepiota fuliginosa MF-IS2]
MDRADSPSDQSKLVSIFVQSVLYGAFFVMFLLSYWSLVHRRPPGRRLNKGMLGVSVTMFVLATIHVTINFIRILLAFIQYGGSTHSYWNRLSEPTHVFGSTVYTAQTIVGDGVAARLSPILLYRCYVVWSRRPTYIVLPGLFFLGSIVTGIGTLVTFEKLGHASIFRLRHWLVAFFSFTLAGSTLCTLMIAIRIWALNRQSLDDLSGRSLSPIIRIVLESGAIYSGALIILLVLFETKSWFQYVLVDAMTPIIGLVFSIIIVRIGLGLTTGDSPPGAIDTINISDCESPYTPYIRPNSHLSRLPQRVSATPSPTRLWPVQPNRPINPPQQNIKTKTSILSFKRKIQRTRQAHYNLRSQAARPSSYFRTSEDMEIDTELEFELDEARYRRPKALPVALMLPRAGHSSGH